MQLFIVELIVLANTLNTCNCNSDVP